MVNTTTRIRDLNDDFRTGRNPSLGRVVATPGVTALGQDSVNELLRKIAAFDQFSEDNDPQGEHDFSDLDFQGEKFFFKIDYYDASLEFGAEDPADPDTCQRVMTVMKASEY